MRFIRFLTWGRWWRHVIAGIERQRRRVDAEVKHFICERGRLQVGQSTRWYEAAMAPNEQLVFARHLDPAIWFHGLVDGHGEWWSELLLDGDGRIGWVVGVVLGRAVLPNRQRGVPLEVRQLADDGLVDHGRVDPQRTAAQRVLLGHEAVFERVRRGAVRQDAA